MKNWSTDANRLKNNPKKYTIWKLEQMINFGLDGKKLPREELKVFFDLLSIDPLKKVFLSKLLWPNRS